MIDQGKALLAAEILVYARNNFSYWDKNKIGTVAYDLAYFLEEPSRGRRLNMTGEIWQSLKRDRPDLYAPVKEFSNICKNLRNAANEK